MMRLFGVQEASHKTREQASLLSSACALEVLFMDKVAQAEGLTMTSRAVKSSLTGAKRKEKVA